MTGDPFTATIENWLKVSMHRSMRNFIHYVRMSGLSMSHMAAMLQIHRSGVCSVSQLGSHLGLTNPAISQMLDRLVEQEYILRTEDPHDRRTKQIELTDKGKQFINEGIQARQRWVSELLQTLSQDEKETIGLALDTLTTKLRALHHEPGSDRTANAGEPH
jgi:DNA-binding MarR family transcriptional regulator